MKERTEYDKLFGETGTYVHAQAQSRQQTRVRRGPYAALIEELHVAGIDVHTTGNKDTNGKPAIKHEFEIDNDVLSREFVTRRMRNL